VEEACLWTLSLEDEKNLYLNAELCNVLINVLFGLVCARSVSSHDGFELWMSDPFTFSIYFVHISFPKILFGTRVFVRISGDNRELGETPTSAHSPQNPAPNLLGTSRALEIEKNTLSFRKSKDSED
jgi:hypothetical protein